MSYLAFEIFNVKRVLRSQQLIHSRSTALFLFRWTSGHEHVTALNKNVTILQTKKLFHLQALW